MGAFSTIEVATCTACDARTPHRRLERGAVTALVASPAVLALAGVALALAAGPSAPRFTALAVTAAVLAVLSVLALASALTVLRRPACERCHAKDWMARHPKLDDAPICVWFHYSILGELVFRARGRRPAVHRRRADP
jgi:hypothetical protein